MTDFKPILTVTLNPAIDRLVEIDDFRLGADNRAQKGVSFAGGKGINVSRALASLGLKSVTAGFAGGANGQNLLRDLLLEGLEHNFVFIQGETRVNLTIRDSKNGKVTRVIDSGPVIDAKDLNSFREKFSRLAGRSSWTVLSGRGIGGTPKSFYFELVKTAAGQGAKVVVDTHGDDLAAALKGKPFLVRINREEAETLLKKKLVTPQDLRQGLKKLLGLGAQQAIISLGSEGAVATDGKVFYQAVCPKVKTVNAVGCGDAMIAGFIFAFKEEDFVGGLAAGVAAGTASCLMPKGHLTAVKPGSLKRADLKRILSDVRIRVL